MHITWQEIAAGFSDQVRFCDGYTDLYFALYQVLERWSGDIRDSRDLSSAAAGFAAQIESAWEARPISGKLEASLIVPAGIHAAVLAVDPAAEALSAFYATANGSFAPAADSAAFETALGDLFIKGGEVLPWFLREGRVQTNEASRSVAWLVPAYIFQAWQPTLSITLVDLGTSAGLNLSADQQNWLWRVDEQPVTINGTPPLVEQGVYSEDPADPGVSAIFENGNLNIVQRIGFDRFPLDIANAEHVLTLRACIWGDQPERMERFDRAVAGYERMIAAGILPRFFQGDILDAAELLPNLIPDDAPKPHLLLVFNSAVTSYLDDPTYDQLRARLMHSFQRLPDGVSGIWLEAELPRYNESVEREKHFVLRARVSYFGGVSSFYLGELEPHPTHLYLRPGWGPLREMLFG